MKILIVRFSSFGDVVQALSLIGKLRLSYGANTEIHFLTKAQFSELIETHPDVNQVWSVNSGQSLQQLFSLFKDLHLEKFDRVVDAHNSLRSKIIVAGLKTLRWNLKLVQKTQKRWKRFLLFRLRINLFEQPFSGQRDLLEILAPWGINSELPPTPQIFVNTKAAARVEALIQDFTNSRPFVVIGASAAHPLKRWPIENFKQLISLNANRKFILVGGSDDDFLTQLSADHCLNLAGQLSYAETLALISMSEQLVTNDTGVLHLGEQLGKKTIALMGPAPFGFPSRKSTVILQRELTCRPCSKHGQGPCVNSTYQACLRLISPAEVSQLL